jgi:hypothetical protein
VMGKIRSDGEGKMGKATDSGGSGEAEAPSTSFYWTYGGKEGREVFNLETTISGSLSEAEIGNHIASAIRAMGSVFRHGGHAQRTGPESDRTISGATTTKNSVGRSSAYEWGPGRTGKS